MRTFLFWIFIFFISKAFQSQQTFYVNQEVNNNFQNGSTQYPFRFLDFLNKNDILTEKTSTTIFLLSNYNESKILSFTISSELNLLSIQNAKFKSDQNTKFEINNGILRIENISFYSCVIINQNGGEILFNVLFLQILFQLFFRM